MVSDALIRHRDGIVGAWTTVAASTYGELPLEGTGAAAFENLRRWEPWVRANIFDFEMQSGLRFAMAAGQANLAHVNAAGVSTTMIAMLRPPQADLYGQLDLVAGYADLREDRASEILSQMIPQVAFWCSVVNLQPGRTKWTFELLDAALRLANFVEMRFKHALAVRRPNELSTQIQPMIQTPGHGALPSGHATEAHIVAYVLSVLVPPTTTGVALREQLMRQAARIAVNRTVAGVHYPVDSAAGQLLGMMLGQYFVRRCVGAAMIMGRLFNGPGYGSTHDFDFRELYTEAAWPLPAPAGWATNLANVDTGAYSPILNWLWQRAYEEWT